MMMMMMGITLVQPTGMMGEKKKAVVSIGAGKGNNPRNALFWIFGRLAKKNPQNDPTRLTLTPSLSGA